MVAPPPGTTVTTNNLLAQNFFVVDLTMVHSRDLVVDVFASQSECRMRDSYRCQHENDARQVVGIPCGSFNGDPAFSLFSRLL